MLVLPDELLLRIGLFLDTKALASLETTCARLWRMCQQDSLWATFLARRVWPQYATQYISINAVPGTLAQTIQQTLHEQFISHLQIPPPMFGYLLTEDGYSNPYQGEWYWKGVAKRSVFWRGKHASQGGFTVYPVLPPEDILLSSLQIWLWRGPRWQRICWSIHGANNFALLILPNGDLEIETDSIDGMVIANIDDMQWHHILLVMRDIGARLEVYVDGTLAISIVDPPWLGKLHFTTGSSYLSEIVGWCCALDEAHVKAIHKSGVPMPGAEYCDVAAMKERATMDEISKGKEKHRMANRRKRKRKRKASPPCN